jgi:hypothetical protein
MLCVSFSTARVLGTAAMKPLCMMALVRRAPKTTRGFIYLRVAADGRARGRHQASGHPTELFELFISSQPNGSSFGMTYA